MDVSDADLADIISLDLSSQSIGLLRSGDFSGLTGLEQLYLASNRLGSLPEDIFSDLTGLVVLDLGFNFLTGLPDGIFSGLTALTGLYLDSNPFLQPLVVSLENVEGSGFRVVVPSGAPFELVVPVTVSNGMIVGGATTVTIPAGAVQSASVTVARTSGTTGDVTVDIGTLPGLPEGHRGYVLQTRAADLPLVVPEPAQITNICGRTPEVRDFIVVSLVNNFDREDDCANVLADDLARFRVVNLSGGQVASLQSGDFSGLTSVTTIRLDQSPLTTLPYGIFADLPALTSISIRDSSLGLPDGMFAGLHNELTTLNLFHLRDLRLLPVSLEQVGENGFKAVARSGAPFGMNVPVTVENGTIAGGATRVRIPVGAVESATLTVVRTPGTIGAVTADIGTLPGLPDGHEGYVLQKADDLPLEVLATNDNAPEFTSAESFAVNENQTTVGTVVATDADAEDVVRYAVTGGADRDRFQIDATTGVLSFQPAPDYEAPADADLDNEYRVTVTATSGTGDRERTAVQTITVTVHDLLGELCERTPQVRDAIVAALGATDCGTVGSEDLSNIAGTLRLDNKEIASLKWDDFHGLIGLTGIWLQFNQLESLPEGLFAGLPGLTTLRLFGNQLSTLPDGIFAGLTGLAYLAMTNNRVSPLPIVVSLEQVGDSGFKAVAPTGAPFTMNVPVMVENGTIAGGATRVRIPVGAVESATLTVVRTPGTIEGVTVDIGTLPGLPNNHGGYALQKAADLPLEVLPAIGVCEHTPQVRDAILAALGETDCASVFDAELATITGFLSLSGQGITSLQLGDFHGLTALTSLYLAENQLESLPEGIFADLTALAELRLRDNRLERLPEGIFAGLNELRTLHLSDNRLERLPEGILADLTALAELRLRDNQVGSLPEGIFAGLNELTLLDLANMQLSSLPESIFADLDALTSLYLSENQLESLPAGIFSGLKALRNLSLLDNRVKPLPIPVSLDKVGDSGLKAVVPTGAPFELVLPITVENGTLEGGATTVTISVGAVESAAVTVARTSGTSGAVTADIQNPAGAAPQPRGLHPAESRRPAAGGAAGGGQRRAGVHQCRVVLGE